MDTYAVVITTDAICMFSPLLRAMFFGGRTFLMVPVS